MSLPSADDLFRPTAPQEPPGAPAPAPARVTRGTKAGSPRAGERPDRGGLEAVPEPVEDDTVETSGSGRRKPSGRVRHDEKMTVYVTSDELL